MYNHLQDTEIGTMLTRIGAPPITSNSEASNESKDSGMKTDDLDNIYFQRTPPETVILNPSAETSTAVQPFLVFIKTPDEISREVDIASVLSKNVQALKRFLFPSEFQRKKVIKLIYRGKLLKDSENLEDLRIDRNMYFHAVILNKNDEQLAEQRSDSASTDAGSFSSDALQLPRETNEAQDQGSNDVHLDIGNLFEQLRYNNRHREEVSRMLMESYEEEGRRRAKIDFMIGGAVGLALGFIGLFVLICLKSSPAKRNGAIYGIILKFLITFLRGGNEYPRYGTTGSNSNSSGNG
jgi:hypothetical protein